MLEARLEDVKSNYRVVVASGNGLPLALSAQVVSAVDAGAFTRYVVATGAEAFASGLRRQGVASVEVFPLSLREFFLEIVRKEESCTTGKSGVTPDRVSSLS